MKFTRKIYEVGGVPAPALPPKPLGDPDRVNDLNAPLPKGTVKKGQYDSIAKELIADARAEAEASAEKDAEYAGDESGINLEPIRQLLKKHGRAFAMFVDKDKLATLQSIAGGDESSVAESSRRFPWQRPGLTDKQRAASFAASLR